MARHRFLLPVALLLAAAGSACAQVNVQLRLGRSQFLAGESVPMEVNITNMSGRDLTFAGSRGTPWIDFIVTSNRGTPIPAAGRPAFGAVKIPSGQAMARSVDLSSLYPLRDLGNYSVYAIVRLPGQERDGYQSGTVRFTVSTAKPYWSQPVGVPGKTGQTHEFRLIRFSSGQSTQLYAQVADHANGRPIRTHHLGEVLFARKPTVTVDRSLNMHVLYLITPSIWGHARVAADGKFLGRDLYKSTKDSGDPGLARLDDGSVRTIGGIPYDPKKEAEERAKLRNASERPDFIYE